MAENELSNEVKYTVKDFHSGQDVRWCPGCGDYSVLTQVQRVFPNLGIKKEKFVFISGIGCSSRFPYYMDTYGFHGIHGRASAIASGIKMHRPDLSVWVATGDGDLLSIGGNHFIHTCRKNVDLKILLFNNKIYGLTKGQYSPTSEINKITRSSPLGTIDYPFNPVALAIGTEATFVARTMDRDTKHLQEMIERAAKHKGTAFIEIFQNCNIFNDGAFFRFTEKESRPDNVVYLKHGEPLVFGKDNDKGIRIEGAHPQVVSLTDGRFTKNDLLVHDEFQADPAIAYILAHMNERPGFPTTVGIIRQLNKPTYDEMLHNQIENAKTKFGVGDLHKLLYDSSTWEVK